MTDENVSGRAPVSDEELQRWAELRADDAGHLARELIGYRHASMLPPVSHVGGQPKDPNGPEPADGDLFPSNLDPFSSLLRGDDRTSDLLGITAEVLCGRDSAK